VLEEGRLRADWANTSVRPMGICEGGGGELAKVQEMARAGCSELLCCVCGGMMRRGASDRKNPLPVVLHRRGYQRRTVWTPTHTARLGAGRRLHCSAPHCKGYCHTDRPTRKPWGFTLTANLYICRAANFCQEDELARRTALPDSVRQVTLVWEPGGFGPPHSSARAGAFPLAGP
jgi:hypothetical protein